MAPADLAAPAVLVVPAGLVGLAVPVGLVDLAVPVVMAVRVALQAMAPVRRVALVQTLKLR
ncbi:MAG: hypothetical protein Devi2KO_15470 [Devosia indica]